MSIITLGNENDKIKAIYAEEIHADNISSINAESVTVNGKDVAQYEDELNNKLDKSGGTMTGTIFTSVPEGLYRDRNNSNLVINGGHDWETSALLRLFGGESPENAGTFTLSANIAGKHSNLIGYPHGELYWNGQHIATTNKLSMPSEAHLILAAEPNPNYYTSPSDGWLNIIGDCTGTINYIYCDSAFGNFLSFGSLASIQCRLSVSVAKGKQFSYGYVGLTNVSIRFFYAESAT